MARVTQAEVKAIRPTDQDVQPMIDAANIVVDQFAVSSCGSSAPDETLAAVELWLAAYFVGTIDPVKNKEKFENWSVEYQLGSNDLSGIMSDRYGQTANILSGGCLAELDKSPAIVEFL